MRTRLDLEARNSPIGDTEVLVGFPILGCPPVVVLAVPVVVVVKPPPVLVSRLKSSEALTLLAGILDKARDAVVERDLAPSKGSTTVEEEGAAPDTDMLLLLGIFMPAVI